MRLVTDWLTDEAKGRVTRLSLGGQDVKTARAILNALPNIESLTIHCKNASATLLIQVAKNQAPNLKELIVTKVSSTVKKESALQLAVAAVNAEVLYLPRVLDADEETMEHLKEAACGSKVRELVMQQMSLRALCALGDAFPNVEKLGIFTTWYGALHPDGMDFDGVMVRLFGDNLAPRPEEEPSTFFEYRLFLLRVLVLTSPSING